METRKEVGLEEFLLRRGYKKHANPDGTPTSRVFKLRDKDEGELSVNVESLTTYDDSIGDSTKYTLFRISNKSVREIDLITYHDPLPDGSNDAHSVIIGMVIEDDIKPGLLAKASRNVI